jgi:hypothetical protein
MTTHVTVPQLMYLHVRSEILRVQMRFCTFIKLPKFDNGIDIIFCPTSSSYLLVLLLP